MTVSLLFRKDYTSCEYEMFKLTEKSQRLLRVRQISSLER